MKRMICVFLASLMLLCACVAQADVLTEWGIPQNIADASGLVQKDVTFATVGDAIVTIKEAAYDGVSVYVFYTLKDTKTDKLLGELDSGSGRYLITRDTCNYFKDKKVGWWKDGITVNGVEYTMPLAGDQYYGSSEPGVQEHYLTIRLDQAGITYGEAKALGLPLANKDGKDSGILTVPLNPVNDKLVIEQRDMNLDLGDTAATHVEAVFTPIKVYVKVKLMPDSTAVAKILGIEPGKTGNQAKKSPEPNGLGPDQQGAAVAVNNSWANDVIIVDKHGKAIEAMMQGFSGKAGTSDDMAMFEFTAMAAYPSEMYLVAVKAAGTPDMAKAVRIH